MSATAETTPELKARIAELEGIVKRREDELRAKEASFAEALARDQQRNRDREAKEAGRRQELQQKNATLMEERSALKSQLATLKDVEDELRRVEGDLKQARRETVDVKLKSAEERRDLEEQLAEGRRQSEKLAHEISDLRCSLSILEHKYQQAESKLANHDSQVEQLSRQEDLLRQTKEKLDTTERAFQVEQLRFARDRKLWDDKLAKLSSEVNAERQSVQRTDIVAKYEHVVAAKNDLIMLGVKSVAALLRTDRNVPVSSESNDTIRLFFERGINYANAPARHQQSTSLSRATSFIGNGDLTPQKKSTAGAAPAAQSPVVASDRSPQDNGGTFSFVDPENEDQILFEALRGSIVKLPDEKRIPLLQRFVDSTKANLLESRCFSETSGFPDSREEPAVLVNHIAVVTAERDALVAKLAALESRAKEEVNNNNQRNSSAASSPAAAAKTTQQPAASPNAAASGSAVSSPRGTLRASPNGRTIGSRA